MLALGEMVTAGFFMLPFAVGAAAAFILALLDVAVGWQWTVFLVVSVASLFALQKWVRREDELDHPTAGATRFVGQRALVLEEVDRVHGRGLVRLETQEWRATTEGGNIAVGTEVIIRGVVGSRLIVEPTDQ